jgi:hypothetical protein
LGRGIELISKLPRPTRTHTNNLPA